MADAAPEDREVPAAGDALVLTRTVDAPPDSVWECLTAPECFKAWWRKNLEFEPALGGRFTEPWEDPSGRARTTRAEVTAYHPPRGFVMVWADEDWDFDTVVSVTLEPAGDGTHVTIEHQGWEAAPEPDRATLLLDHRDGWQRHLAGLASHAEEHHVRRKGNLRNGH
ncbi:MAG TPA: SRPBCC domain-containing protein [Aurantimonas sp.]|nr:SRPBCC domain-containing protein [Aurantimonas sp.]